MQMVLKSLIRNIFIDKQSLLLRDAISNQRHQMPMVHATDNIDLSPEFPLSLPATGLKLLDRHHFPILHPALVDTPKTALAKHILAGKSVGNLHQLLVGEMCLMATNIEIRV